MMICRSRAREMIVVLFLRRNGFCLMGFVYPLTNNDSFGLPYCPRATPKFVIAGAKYSLHLGSQERPYYAFTHVGD